MLFSIVVPIYGVEQFLTKCIESILQQNYRGFELILVDDGSKDSSGKICDQYARKDKRIKVIHKENGGLVSARKAGANIAKGQYIVPIDGDDWVSVELLKDLASVINEIPNLEVICYGINQGVGKGNYIQQKIGFPNGLYQQKKIREIIYPSLIKGRTGIRFMPNLCGKAVLREKYMKFQSIVPNGLNLGEDAAVTYPLISKANSIYILYKWDYYYRMNTNSMTKSRKEGFDWNNLRVLEKVWSKMLNQDYDFKPQIARYMCHDLFNVAKSHLQTNRLYDEVRNEILQELHSPDFQNYIHQAHFNIFCKEQLPKLLLETDCILGIKLLAKFI